MILRILCLLVLTSSMLVAADNKEQITIYFTTKRVSEYPAEAFTAPRDLSVGQWVRYGMVDDDDVRSIMITRIILHEGDEWTIEMERMAIDTITITQFNVKGLDAARISGKSDDMVITKMKIKSNNDEVVVIDGVASPMAMSAYSKALTGLTAPSTNLGDGGKVRVSAGTFLGTTLLKTELAVNGESIETTSHVHTAVPIYGVVKSISGDEFKMELLDFGETDAVASF